MRGNKAKSRMAHYQQSSAIPIDEIPQSRPQQINDLFEAEQNDLDNVEIAFDPNEIIANFGGRNDRDNSQEHVQEREFLDPFADIPVVMKNASSDGSDFYDQEDQDNVAEMQPVVQTSTIEPEFNFPTTVNEIDRAFINEVEEIEDDNNNNAIFKPFTLGSLAQIPQPVQPSSSYSTNNAGPTVNSYMNYQMGAAMRGAQKKKPAVNRAVNNNQNKKPDILQMDNDDIGEVGEWVGKSANVNAKRDEDDEEDESEERNNNDSDDFDGVFDAPADRKPAVPKNPKNNTEDEEEAGGKFDFEAMAKQSNLAMQKAQGSTAFKAAKNRGPFMNSLKEKADKLKKVEDVPTEAENKFKQTLQFGVDVSNNMKTSTSTNPASKNGDNAPMNETEKDEEESPKPIAQQIANRVGAQKEKIEAQKAKIEAQKEKLETQKGKIEAQKEKLEVQKDKITNKFEDVKKKAAEVDLFSGSEKASPVQNLEDEWDRVTKVTAQQASQKEGKADEITVLSFNEAWEIAKKISLSDEKRRVQEEVNASRGFLQKLFSCGKGGLPAPLLDERDQILALAKVPFNESDDFHFNLLQSIYIKITGKVKEVPRFGPHWETIGFQGRDPATDLRVRPIYKTCRRERIKKMWKHSTHEKYNFPLCISGFSVTQAMMETLRAEKLNGAIIARKSVIEVFNEGYYATFYKLVNIYETNTYTIAEYPIAKKSAIDLLKTNPTKMLFDFKAASMSLMSPLSGK